MENHHRILHIRISLGSKFQLHQTIVIFGRNLPRKSQFESIQSKATKNEHQHWIFHTRVSLITKFQLKLTILTFLDQICLKKVFWSKPRTVSTTTELCICALELVSNFSLTDNFGFLEQICPKKGIFGRKQKKSASPLN